MGKRKRHMMKDKHDLRKRERNSPPPVVSRVVTSKSPGWKGDYLKKKGENLVAREESVYLRLGEISEEYPVLEVGREKVLKRGRSVWKYGVSVGGNLVVGGETFDLEEEEERNGLISFLRLERGSGLNVSKRDEEILNERDAYLNFRGQLEEHVEKITTRGVVHNDRLFRVDFLRDGGVRTYRQGDSRKFSLNDSDFRENFLRYIDSGE